MKIALDFGGAHRRRSITMPKRTGLEWSEVLRVANEEGFQWSAIGTARNWFTQREQLGRRPKIVKDNRGRPTEDSLRAALKAHRERRAMK